MFVNATEKSLKLIPLKAKNNNKKAIKRKNNDLKYLSIFKIHYLSKFVVSSGKIIVGLNVFASSCLT